MKKNVRNTVVLAALLFLLFSCSSSPRYSGESSPEVLARSGYMDGEVLQASRETDASEDRMIAYTASLELSVKDTEATRNALIENTKSNNGFIVRETDTYITARIPSENLDNYIKEAKTLGKIENESKTGTDITDQYRDNVIRLDNLKNVRDRYLALLGKANSITDVLAIEKELQRVVLEIERLEGAIKNAELSVTYSSVTVRFRVKAKPGPVGWVFYGIYSGIKWLFVWN